MNEDEIKKWKPNIPNMLTNRDGSPYQAGYEQTELVEVGLICGQKIFVQLTGRYPEERQQKLKEVQSVLKVAFQPYMSDNKK